jgi:predicted Zn-dependent peptidase
MTGVESVATSVMVGVGSRYEELPENGISHFLEHMVFKGTQKYPTTEDVNFIERLGGLQNAYTDIDITNYHNKTLATDWKDALEINKELALHPRLEQTYVDKERDVIIEEMKRYEDEPSAKVGEAFHELVYGNTKLGRRIIGTEKSLRGQNAAELRAYHDRWYIPEKTVVVIAGKMDDARIAESTKQVEEWFAGVPAVSAPTIETLTDTQTEPKVMVVTKPDASQAHINLGLRIFNRNSEERFTWGVFNLLFGVSFTSRLFKEIREKKGLCYHIRSSSDTWDDVGYWSIYAGVGTDKVEEAIDGIMLELRTVVQSGVTEDEVAVAKKRLSTMLAFKAEDPEFLNEYYGRQELYGQPIMTLSDYLERIQAVDAESINSLVRKYIVTKTMNLAVVWNKGADENLQKLLVV